MSRVSKKARSAMKVRMAELLPYGSGRRKSPFEPVMGGTDGYGWFGPDVVQRVNAASWYVQSRLSEMSGSSGKKGMCVKCAPMSDLYRLCIFAANDQLTQEAAIVRIDRFITNSRYWELWVSLVRKDLFVPISHDCLRGDISTYGY